MTSRSEKERVADRTSLDRQDILNGLEVRIGPAQARAWLSTHRDRLDGKTPMEALEDDEVDRVREVLPFKQDPSDDAG